MLASSAWRRSALSVICRRREASSLQSAQVGAASVSQVTEPLPVTAHHDLKQTLGTWQLWGIAVGLVISGEYFGWSYGWANAGTLGFLVTSLLIAAMYATFIFSFTELTCSAAPARRRPSRLCACGLRSHRRLFRRCCHIGGIRLRTPCDRARHRSLPQRAVSIAGAKTRSPGSVSGFHGLEHYRRTGRCRV